MWGCIKQKAVMVALGNIPQVIEAIGRIAEMNERPTGGQEHDF